MSIQSFVNFGDYDLTEDWVHVNSLRAELNRIDGFNTNAFLYRVTSQVRTRDWGDGRTWVDLLFRHSSSPHNESNFIFWKPFDAGDDITVVHMKVKVGTIVSGNGGGFGFYVSRSPSWSNSTPILAVVRGSLVHSISDYLNPVNPYIYSLNEILCVEVVINKRDMTFSTFINERPVQLGQALSTIGVRPQDTVLNVGFGSYNSRSITNDTFLASVSDLIIVDGDGVEPTGRLGVTAKVESLPIESEVRSDWELPDGEGYTVNSEVVGEPIPLGGGGSFVTTYDEGAVDEYNLSGPAGPFVYASKATLIATNTSGLDRYISMLVNDEELGPFKLSKATGEEVKKAQANELISKIGYKSIE